MKLSIPDYILSIKPYTPGKPLEELEREYGIADSIKLASNENPLGPSPMAVKAIKNAIGKTGILTEAVIILFKKFLNIWGYRHRTLC